MPVAPVVVATDSEEDDPDECEQAGVRARFECGRVAGSHDRYPTSLELYVRQGVPAAGVAIHGETLYCTAPSGALRAVDVTDGSTRWTAE